MQSGDGGASAQVQEQKRQDEANRKAELRRRLIQEYQGSAKASGEQIAAYQQALRNAGVSNQATPASASDSLSQEFLGL